MPIEILLEKALSKKSIETAIDLYDVSSEFLTPIKRYLQQDPSSGTQAALYLISKLKSKSSARRAKIIFLMDYLLCRCQSFRNKLLVDVSFVNEVLEDSQTDEAIKTQFMQLLELWDLKYGRSYPSMRCLCRYLRETVRVVTVDVVVSYHFFPFFSTRKSALLRLNDRKKQRNSFKIRKSVKSIDMIS